MADYIEKEQLKHSIKRYFKHLIDKGKYKIDVLDANADIHKIISELPAIERLPDADVVVFPVKLGQTVYCINYQRSNPSVSERKVRKIEFDGDYKIKDEMLCTWYECEIGHTVFLTREEAEQALKERNKDV